MVGVKRQHLMRPTDPDPLVAWARAIRLHPRHLPSDKLSCRGRITLRQFRDDLAVGMFVPRIEGRAECEVDEFFKLVVAKVVLLDDLPDVPE